MKKRVSFSITQTAYCNPHQLTVEERKQICWYSEDELVPSRNDARQAIEVLQNGETGECFVRLVPADVCIRGIEKYADAMAKVTGQRRLIESVIGQQKKCAPETLGDISRYLSQPFKDLARYFAHRSLEDGEYQSGPFVSESSCGGPIESSSKSSNVDVGCIEDAPDDQSETTEIDANASMKRSLSLSSCEDEDHHEEDVTSLHATAKQQRNVKQRTIQYSSE